MILTKNDRMIGIKYNTMMVLMTDIHNRRYDELQQLYEALNLITNEKLVSKLEEKRNIGEMFTDTIYVDILLVIGDYLTNKPELIDLFESLYCKRFPYTSKSFYDWERQYKSNGYITKSKKLNLSEGENYFLHFLFYRSEVFTQPDKVLRGFNFERDKELLNYSFYLSDKNIMDDQFVFCSDESEIEDYSTHFTENKEPVIQSKFFERYLVRRRNELAEYLNIEEKRIAEYIHSEMKSHSKDGISPVRQGAVGLIETFTKNIIANHNGGTTWYNNMTATNNSKEYDNGFHYVPDVDLIIENYFKSYVITRYIEEVGKRKGFTKLTLSRECIPESYETVYQIILCMYEMDVLYKMFSIMQKQYYRDFSWEKVTNQDLTTRYEHIISDLELIIKEKESRINLLSQKNQVLSAQITANNSKQTAPLVAENNKLLKVIEEKDDIINDLKKRLQYQEEFITELNKNEIEIQNNTYSLEVLQSKRYLFVGRIGDALPELKHRFPNSLFMETESFNLSQLDVDAIVMLIKWMSHSMFYKLKSSGNLSQTKTIMCNTKNIDTVLQKVYDNIV